MWFSPQVYALLVSTGSFCLVEHPAQPWKKGFSLCLDMLADDDPGGASLFGPGDVQWVNARSARISTNTYKGTEDPNAAKVHLQEAGKLSVPLQKQTLLGKYAETGQFLMAKAKEYTSSFKVAFAKAITNKVDEHASRKTRPEDLSAGTEVENEEQRMKYKSWYMPFDQ